MARLRNTSTISSNRKLRHAAPALAVVILLGGCSYVGHGDVSSLYAIGQTLWRHDQKVTLEQAAAVPYASIGIRVGDGRQTMIVLAGDAGGQRLWTSAAKIAITTNGPRIVRTAGFGHDLAGYEPRGETLAADGARIVRWQADFPDLNLYSVAITCRDRQAGRETIVILGKEIHTLRIDEACAAQDPRLDWSFDNTYWLDPTDGLAWRSIQNVNPKLDAIETEILRPPA